MATALMPTGTELAQEGRDKAAKLNAQVRVLADAAVDARAHTSTMRVMVTPDAQHDENDLNSKVHIVVESENTKLAISDMAHDQFAEKLSIPKPYYRRMLASQPQLLAANMNCWLQREPETRLIRMMKPITQEQGTKLELMGASLSIRAVLGATYRPLDNAELVTTALPVMEEHGAYLREFHITEQRLHARFVTEQRSIQEIRDAAGYKPGDHQFVEEIVRMGASLRNSETGFASLDVAGFVEILKCLNGLIVPAQVKVRHVGKRHAADEVFTLSDQTHRLDNAAIFSRVRDALVASLDAERQAERATAILDAKVAQIAVPQDRRFEFIGNLARNLELTEAESAVLQEGSLRAQIEEGSLTRFAMSQGVTALAREMGDFDRRTELERAGWQIITGDTSRLFKAGLR